MLVFADKSFAATVCEMLEKDFAECRQATAEELASRPFCVSLRGARGAADGADSVAVVAYAAVSSVRDAGSSSGENSPTARAYQYRNDKPVPAKKSSAASLRPTPARMSHCRSLLNST